MSRIATMILAATAGAAAGEGAVTAVEALTRSYAVTSIGPDPCRRATGDEIVVCARRVNPYAVPLYDSTADEDASQSGGNRVRQMREVRSASTRCEAQGLVCTEGGLDVLAIADFVGKGVGALIDDE